MFNYSLINNKRKASLQESFIYKQLTFVMYKKKILNKSPNCMILSVDQDAIAFYRHRFLAGDTLINIPELNSPLPPVFEKYHISLHVY